MWSLVDSQHTADPYKILQKSLQLQFLQFVLPYIRSIIFACLFFAADFIVQTGANWCKLLQTNAASKRSQRELGNLVMKGLI